MKFYRTYIVFTTDRKMLILNFYCCSFLISAYCLPFILYATEAVPLTKSSVNVLDDCV